MVNKNSDSGFLLPSAGGSQGAINMAGTNSGGEHKIKTYKQFYDGEYRKGSNKYGQLVNDIMMFLRLPEYKDHINDNDGLKFNIGDFEKKSNISIEDIKKMLLDKYKNKLLSFDITIEGNFIIFKNIKNTRKQRFVWGENVVSPE